MDVVSSLQVIYVMRNPKDVLTSYYHYHDMASYMVNPGPQSDFLLKFLKGKGFSAYDIFNISITL